MIDSTVLKSNTESRRAWSFTLCLLLLLCTQPAKAAGTASVIDYGAIPDDSVDDVAAFTLAMDGSHGILNVPAGRYVLSDLSNYIPLYSNKTVLCENGAELWVPPDAITQPVLTEGGYTFSPVFGASDRDATVHRFTMEGCRFIIEKAGVTPVQIERERGSKIHLRNLEIDGKGQTDGNQAAYGLYLNRVSQSSITGTRISYTRDGGIFARLPDRVLMENNEIRFAGVDFNYPFDDPGAAVFDHDYWNAAGISAPSAKNSVVRGNVLDNTGGVGILLRGGSKDSHGNAITDNWLSNIGKGGIGIGIREGGDGDTVDNVISGNVIQGYMLRWADAGININHRGEKGKVENLLIENNWIDLLPSTGDYPLHGPSQQIAYPQIIIESSEAARLSAVTVRGNALRNAPGAAISIRYAEVVDVQGNELGGAARVESISYALAMYDNNDCTVGDNVVRSLGIPYSVVDAPRLLVVGESNVINNNLIEVQDPESVGLPVVLTNGSGYTGSGNMFVSPVDVQLD